MGERNDVTGLITNASAQTALRQLRLVAQDGDLVRSQVSTGLKVQSAEDNAAFFMVAAQTRGDAGVMRGLSDNLLVARGAVNAAQAAGKELGSIITQMADLIAAAQQGIAIEELNTAYEALIDQATDIIDSAGFQGINLLSTDDTITTVLGLDRTNGAFDLQTLSLDGGDFKKKVFYNAVIETGSEFVLQAENFSGKQDVGVDAWTPSSTDPGFLVWEDLPGPNKIYTNAADVQANAPRLDYRVQITNPGTYYVNVRGIGGSGTSDSIHVGFDGNVLTGNGGVRIPQGGSARWGSTETGTGNRVAVTITTPGIHTINIWGREDGTQIDGIVFRQDPSTFSGSTALPPATAIAGNGDLAFFSDLIEGEARRDAAGFMELLKAVTPESSQFAPQSSLQILDGARAKLNRYLSQLGSYEKTIDRQRDHISLVASQLDTAVASLVEADLVEASSRLAAIQVQEQLANQSLTIANDRPASLLSLFR